jgi:hypothetical protein
MAFGAQKYGDHNWRGGIKYTRLLGAAKRHIKAFNMGEDLDPESGLSHVAHAICCLGMLLGMINERPDLDDRYKRTIKDLTQSYLETAAHLEETAGPHT